MYSLKLTSPYRSVLKNLRLRNLSMLLYQLIFATMSTVSILFRGMFPSKPSFTEKDYPDLTGKVYFVTGSTSGVGIGTVKLLLAQGAKVYVHGRSTVKLEAAIEEIEKDVPQAQLERIIFDLADLTTVKEGIRPLLKEQRIDGVVLNAGVAHPPQGSRTKQGYELQLGTNNIGHQLVIRLLTDLLGRSPGCRVVWVSSMGHVFSPATGGVNWDYDNKCLKELDDMNTDDQYTQSKVINIIQSYQWTKHTPVKDVVSLALHPGILATTINRDADWGSRMADKLLGYPPKYGSYCEVYALLSPDVGLVQPPIYVSAYGQIQPNMVRSDVLASTTGQLGNEVWEYLDKDIERYL